MGSSLGSGWLALPICTIPRVKRQDEEKFKVTEIRNMQWDARGDKQKRRWKSQMNKKAVRSFFSHHDETSSPRWAWEREGERVKGTAKDLEELGDIVGEARGSEAHRATSICFQEFYPWLDGTEKLSDVLGVTQRRRSRTRTWADLRDTALNPNTMIFWATRPIGLGQKIKTSL